MLAFLLHGASATLTFSSNTYLHIANGCATVLRMKAMCELCKLLEGTLLFNGMVRFSLGQNRHALRVVATQLPLLSKSVLPKSFLC